MPKKLLPPEAVPTLIQERLRLWGISIRTQRLAQHIRAADLCRRMGISEATLRRLEHGDAGAGAGLYLTAFHILGLFEELAPLASRPLLQESGRKQRVRLPSKEDDESYF